MLLFVVQFQAAAPVNQPMNYLRNLGGASGGCPPCVKPFQAHPSMKIRKARQGDVAAIVAMLADDPLGKTRENYRDPLPAVYKQAFRAIDSNPDHELIVVEADNAEVVGTLQLSFIQYLTYRGGVRAQIEAVRIRSDRRGEGVGELMVRYAVARARSRGAHVVQLTTDKQRPDALRFYEKLGFTATHEGMKLHLD